MLLRAFPLVVLLSLGSGAQPAPNDYGKPESWLCRPGRTDACSVDLTTTVIEGSGKQRVEKWTRPRNPPIDCFYVYPTVSLDTAPNSDMSPGPEEANVIRQQFARFASVCRPFAPLYRQVTLTALRSAIAGKPMAADRALAYNDVVAAWRHYLENDNRGRGVVLIGHSQGTGILIQLIREHIDGKPVQQRIVSALLLGGNVPVARGKDVGGAFRNLPLCRKPSQTGCVVTYVSFRSNAPPPDDSRFGRVQGVGMEASCTNPAALAGGSGELKAYFLAARQESWVSSGPPIETPFVTLPGLLSAKCVSNEHGSYFEVTVKGDAADPRADDIPGDVIVNGAVQANWGLHLVDVNLAIGNLIEIIREQGKAYLASIAGR